MSKRWCNRSARRHFPNARRAVYARSRDIFAVRAERGVNDFGLGAAIAVFLFLLVIPILILNIRRFRREI